jgi:D-glycero-D-manno-heptose 1,7-bisphosphate phosphatase
MNKILLVDINGTITKTLDGSPFTLDTEPTAIELIPGVTEALDRYVALGFAIIGVSNQGGIEAGFRSHASVQSEMQHTMLLAPQISEILYCPDFKGLECWSVTPFQWAECHNSDLAGAYRKPNPGMLQWAMPDAPYFAVMVGDRDEDRQAAAAIDVIFLDAAAWREGAIATPEAVIL